MSKTYNLADVKAEAAAAWNRRDGAYVALDVLKVSPLRDIVSEIKDLPYEQQLRKVKEYLIAKKMSEKRCQQMMMTLQQIDDVPGDSEDLMGYLYNSILKDEGLGVIGAY